MSAFDKVASAAFVALMMTTAEPALAQRVAPVRAGTWELNGAVGYTYGLDRRPGDRSRVNGGATLSYALTKQILPYVEYSYFPGITRVSPIVDGLPNSEFRYRIPMSDFHGGVHLRFTPAESRFTPYAAVGLGALRSLDAEGDVYENGQYVTTLRQDPTTSFAVNFGGGLRYYVGQYWGVRFEGKAYKPTGTFDKVFAKLQFGVFWQFGGR